MPSTFPVLFLAGKKDELVVPGQMKGLWELCSSEQKEWREYDEGTHSESAVAFSSRVRVCGGCRHGHCACFMRKDLLSQQPRSTDDTCAQPHYFSDIASFISKHSRVPSSSPAPATAPAPISTAPTEQHEKQDSAVSSPVSSSASVESFEIVNVDGEKDEAGGGGVTALSMGPRDEVDEVVDEATGRGKAKGRL